MYISEVMAQTGLSKKAINLYEEKGLLYPCKVPKGEYREYRYFTEEDVKRLELIAGLREIGLSLNDIEKIINGEKADIILQKHLKQQQESLSTLLNIMNYESDILSKLPPNASLDVLEDCIASLSGTRSHESRKSLDEYVSEGHSRRVAMLLYEAFLDRPLDTPERWNAWNELIDNLEENISEENLDAYAYYYDSLSTNELCEDYTLRRQLVCGYAEYTEEDEQEKAKEIYDEMKLLLQNENVFSEWNDFYHRIAVPGGMVKGGEKRILLLSSVYEKYKEHFISMKSKYLEPLLSTTEGELVQKVLKKKMGDDMFTFQGIIYFDFYNHTIRRIRSAL